jgi:glycosyltransferase involved in cell wall biosynthesis
MSSVRRVVLVTTHYPPLVGGAATYFFHLATSLAQQGLAVRVLTTAVDGQPRHETVHGVSIARVIPNMSSAPGGIRRWLQMVATLYHLKILRLRGGVSVVHTHASKSVTVGAALFSRLWRVPVVFDVQDFLSRPRVLKMGWQRRYVATGQPIADHLQRLGISARNILVIPSIPPDETRRPVPARTRSGSTMVFVGELHREIKGEDVLLQAFTELHRRQPGVKLVMVGDGPDRQLDEEYIVKHHLTMPVQLRGALPAVRTQDEIYAADWLVVSSHTEGMPRVILEAFASGLPVIATRVGGIPEVVHNGQNGLLVPPNDPAALAAAMETFVLDPALRQRLGAAGRNWIDSLPTWPELAQRIADFYPQTA